MHKSTLVRLVRKGLSTRRIAATLNCSQTNIRHWLKKFGVYTNPFRPGRDVLVNCEVCGRPTLERRHLCPGCYTKVRRYRAKTAAVVLLGGKCNRCDWSGNLAGYEFHHKHGNKDIKIGSCANKSWDVVKKEVLKCELLCSRCHQIEHSNNEDPRFLAAVEKYRGRPLG